MWMKEAGMVTKAAIFLAATFFLGVGAAHAQTFSQPFLVTVSGGSSDLSFQSTGVERTRPAASASRKVSWRASRKDGLVMQFQATNATAVGIRLHYLTRVGSARVRGASLVGYGRVRWGAR
jgi:hypothetical protein